MLSSSDQIEHIAASKSFLLLSQLAVAPASFTSNEAGWPGHIPTCSKRFRSNEDFGLEISAIQLPCNVNIIQFLVSNSLSVGEKNPSLTKG